MKAKRFHCQGGAVFSLLHPPALHLTIPLIVSFQTISDYLDNLCDRLLTEKSLSISKNNMSDFKREQAFRCLHNAMLNALDPEASPNENYYRFYPYTEDGGYLEALVRHCQNHVKELPSFYLIKERASHLTRLYCDLQSLKHLSKQHRQAYLESWFQSHTETYNHLRWNEFAAASGSTLGVFALFALSSRKQTTSQEIEQIERGYFPWICGLHILLDYMVDQEEDRREEDLNFVTCYQDQEQGLERLKLFVHTALNRAGELDNPVFHQTAVKGLLALYLSDPKIKSQGLQDASRALLAAAKKSDVFSLRCLCQGLRKVSII